MKESPASAIPKNKTMKKLIGKECGCIFALPEKDQPVKGIPAWVIVMSVDLPMIEMRSLFDGAPFWINASKIAQIWKVSQH